MASFIEPQELISDLEHRLQEKDAILVKGSRGMRMERIVQSLLVDEAALETSPAIERVQSKHS
jgi:UDP-N-acetylmuramyl pentapeptide synthase